MDFYADTNILRTSTPQQIENVAFTESILVKYLKDMSA